MSEDIVGRDELRAVVAARKELGEDMEPALIDAFVERIERRLEHRGVPNEKALKAKREHQKEIVMGAMGISIPLFVVAAIFVGFAGILVVCAVLAVIAVVSTRT